MTLAENMHEHYITKVWGTANGTDSTFRREHGVTWKTIVPRAEDGVWECELWAENEAGNTAYLEKTLYAITGHELRIRPVRDTCYHVVETKHHRRGRCYGNNVCDGKAG